MKLAEYLARRRRARVAAVMLFALIMGFVSAAPPVVTGCQAQDLTPAPDTSMLSPAVSALAQEQQEPAAQPLPEKWVCLTFDDGPWPKTTEALLDGLAQRGVKATFFLVGEQVADHQDTVRRMADEGHQIGLHTWHHVSLQGMTREEIAAQLGKTQQTIQAVVGPEELMLRPPYGFVDETLKQWAKTPIVCWSVDTEDWKDQNVERIVQTVTQQAEDGDIILMHDIFETSVTAALACVDRLMAQGYYFVTVEELFALRGEVPQEGGVYLSLPPKT